MRLRITELNLIGSKRIISFEKGLNIVVGPIATGKTTLIKLLRACLGGSLENLPPEAKAVTVLEMTLTIGETQYSITRNAVSTPTSLVDIAGGNEFIRLPFTKKTDSGTKKLI